VFVLGGQHCASTAREFVVLVRVLQNTPEEAEMGRIVVMNHVTLDG
jgi:hypothetical protein